MVKCESLRINMFRLTHTGKSMNFPVTVLKIYRLYRLVSFSGNRLFHTLYFPSLAFTQLLFPKQTKPYPLTHVSV